MAARKFFILLICFVAPFILFPSPATAQKQGSYKDMAKDVLKNVNKHRLKKGLKPLVMNDVVSRIAEEHSRNMGDRKVPFGHKGMDERVARACKELRISYSRWAENVASGQNSAEGVVASWLTSAGHTENIEGEYNLTGIGIVKGANGNLYFTQIFIYKKR